MRKLFNSQFKITQEFGVNKEYYKKFGLAGHEGIDLIPNGSVWDVYALEDGVVVLDDDIAGSVSSDPYGKIVTLWHPKIKKATMYCHLAENYVTHGQTVKAGEKIGKMGSTGNSSGAHVHLNLFETDDNGNRLNRNNGYLGGINPLPFLQEDLAVITQPSDKADQIKRAYKALTGQWVKQEEIDPWIKRDLSLDDTMIEIMKGDGRFKELWVKPYITQLEEDIKILKGHLEQYKKQQPQPKADEVIVKTVKTYPSTPSATPKTPPVTVDPVFSGMIVNLLQTLKKKLGF